MFLIPLKGKSFLEKIAGHKFSANAKENRERKHKPQKKQQQLLSKLNKIRPSSDYWCAQSFEPTRNLFEINSPWVNILKNT